MKLYIRICMLVQAMAILCVCGAAQGRTIIDMAGRTVVVPDEIRSVYGTSPPVTHLVYAVDPGSVAGLNFPPDKKALPFLDPRIHDLPVVGGWFGQGRTPNLETLLSVRPDVVAVWMWGKPGVDEKIEKMLTPLGFPVVFLNMDALSEYPAALRFMGRLLGKTERAGTLARYAEETLQEMAALRASIPEKDRVSVYYAQGADGLSTECDTSLHAELIPLCGGVNVHKCVARDGYGMEGVSMEQVYSYNPDTIVTRDGYFYKSVANSPRWRGVRAVKNGRVYLIPALPVNWFDRPPSFMRLLGARWLVHNLYPMAYKRDIRKDTREFYRLFLNVDLDETSLGEVLP